MNWLQKHCASRLEFSQLPSSIEKALNLLNEGEEPFVLVRNSENSPTPQFIIEQGLPDIRIVNMAFLRNEVPGDLLIQLRYGSGQALTWMNMEGQKFPNADELTSNCR
jgi:hypothetical protein